MKTAVLFDLDGTLMDTLQDLTDSVNYTLAQFGLPGKNAAQVRRLVGHGARNLVAQAVNGQADPEAALAVYWAHYVAHCRDHTAPYPGVLEVLETLKTRYPVGIVSNKPDDQVQILCREYFPGVYALGESPAIPKKPAPDMLLRAMKDLGADRCVYVGDGETDVLTAQNAGMPCLSVLWGFRDREDLEAVGAEHFCACVQQLPGLIGELIKE